MNNESEKLKFGSHGSITQARQAAGMFQPGVQERLMFLFCSGDGEVKQEWVLLSEGTDDH